MIFIKLCFFILLTSCLWNWFFSVLVLWMFFVWELLQMFCRSLAVYLVYSAPFDQYNTFLLFFKQLRKSLCFFLKSQRAAVCVFMSLDIGPRCEQHIRATHILCIDNRIQFDVLQYIRDAPILCIDNHILFEFLKLLRVLASLCIDNCIHFVSHIRKLMFKLPKCLGLPAIDWIYL